VVSLALVAIESGLWIARHSFVTGGATRGAVGIAAVSAGGSVMMTVEAIMIGIVAMITRPQPGATAP
jgi:hypothetical protein